MLVESESAAAVHARRLEHGPPSQERFVIGREDRRVRIDQAASRNGYGLHLHQARASSGRAFTQDSSISASGSESQTMPPPTQRWISPSTTAKVRIVSARSRSPFA